MSILTKKVVLISLIVAAFWCCRVFGQQKKNRVQKSADGWEQLNNDALHSGKQQWRKMLLYVAGLHKKATHPAQWPFDYEWEDLGPGYVYGNAFGHWDVVHETIDVLPSYPTHALHQLLNDVKNQEANGLLPGSIYMPGGISKRDSVSWNKTTQGHPPLWPVAVQDYIDLTGDQKVLNLFYPVLLRQISWFENNRKADDGGFFYNDILLKKWESGVDEGIRFDDVAKGAMSCIDATSHVLMMYSYAADWSKVLGLNASWYRQREIELRKFIQENLYVKEDGMFYDIWSVENPSLRHLAFESMWAIVSGAATKEQADKYIDRYLLDTTAFLTAHPVATVGKRDPKFENRMWRGPAWNSMSYWAARGCLRYGRKVAAKIILEKALDESAVQFARTGTVWEFYSSTGGHPEELSRKPNTKYNVPCRDYLGHNPLIAMSRMYDKIR